MGRESSIRTGLTGEEIKHHADQGKFSSDRSIRDYCDRVWNIKPGH